MADAGSIRRQKNWGALLWPLAIVIVGVAAGLGATTFVYARGSSYLTNDPKACMNCHVMREQFSGWERGSHRTAAGCNDCHAPHSLIPKLYVKARNGFFHSLYFTTGRFHEPIEITPRNRAVTEAQCRYCHAPIVANIDAHAGAGGRTDEPLACTTACHRSVGHLH